VTEDDRARPSVTNLVRRVRKRIAGRMARGEAGVGLIEAMVAIVILLVVLVPATYLMDSAVQQSASARERVAATEVAEQALEQLGNDSLTTLEGELDTSYSLGSDIVAGVTYNVTGFLTWQGVGSAPDLCSSGSPPVSISATATVTWGSGPTRKLAEQSVISPSYGLPVFYLAQKLKSGTTNITSLLAAGNPLTIAGNASLTIGAESSTSQVVTVASGGVTNSTTVNVNSFTANATYPVGTPVALPGEGYLAVQVNGVSGSAPSDVSQVTVQIKNTITGVSQSYTPDSNGCVFAQEVPDSYNVTLGSTSSPPFLNAAESQSPTTSLALAVSVGSVTVSTWTFDQGANVTFTPSGTVPVAGGTPVSVLNTGITGTNDWLPAISAGSSATSAYLFPFTSAYTVWYGDCLAEQPATPPTAAVTPGATASVPMTGLGNLTFNVEKTSAMNPPWTGATIAATIADPNMSTDSCPADNLTLPATSTTGLSEAGMVETNRQDTTATWTSNSATVTDPAITANDQGKEVFGAGIPANAYIGTVVSGTTFQLYSTPIAGSQNAGSQLKTTASGSSLSVVSETYTVTITAPDSTTWGPYTVVVTPGGVVYTVGAVSTFVATGSPILVKIA
jgi:Tfp pilus assembly protein PilV